MAEVPVKVSIQEKAGELMRRGAGWLRKNLWFPAAVCGLAGGALSGGLNFIGQVPQMIYQTGGPAPSGAMMPGALGAGLESFGHNVLNLPMLQAVPIDATTNALFTTLGIKEISKPLANTVAYGLTGALGGLAAGEVFGSRPIKTNALAA